VTATPSRALGADTPRLEARDKVTGAARYAAEHLPPETAYAWPVPATVARGTVRAVDTVAALTDPDVLLVLTHVNAPRLVLSGDPMRDVLQSAKVAHHGQYVALAVAETPEAARAAAEAVRVEYDTEPHDVELTEDHPGLYVPEKANGGHPGLREHGEVDAELAAAPVLVDRRYRIPPLHNHPMEPHGSVARWEDGRLLVHDTTQGTTGVRDALAGLFGLDPEMVEVTSEHVGGGFGSKGTARPQVVLASMAALVTGRPVKLALPRRQMAAVVGHRAPSLQRIRIGAGPDGRIRALEHAVVTATSTGKEFVEQAAVPSRVMYAAPASRTAHRVTALDLPTPSWMRAPGEAPGSFALECAMDELAEAVGLDPVELRLRNEPETEPDTGKPFSSRHLADCLREGARRFGWHDRDPRPGSRREGPLLIGSGVACGSYPVILMPAGAEAEAAPDGTYLVRVNATDIGTGARTVMAQIAADALRVPLGRVRIAIGCSTLPRAGVAGGSSGTGSWGWAVSKACEELRARLDERGGEIPPDGLTATADTGEDLAAGRDHARHSFGAQFAEVQVDTDTGEVRLRRMLGVFAAGRIMNPRLARSQFTGGMVMGMSMALLEGSAVDPRYGDFLQRDLASYHIASHADVRGVEAHWIEEEDPHLGPTGAKGIGELGIVGAAAAVANAVHHATGIRVRELPIVPDRLLPGLHAAPRG